MKVYPKPTQSGFYWARLRSDTDHSRWEVVEVYSSQSAGKLYVNMIGKTGWTLESFKWGPGPLPEPKGN